MFIRRPLVVLFSCSLALAACSKAQAPAETPAEPAEDAAPADTGEAPPERPSLTAEECAESGGEVIGDIGDGALHRPDYVCASGSKPRGSIRAPEGGPVAIEGSVCCPKWYEGR